MKFSLWLLLRKRRKPLSYREVILKQKKRVAYYSLDAMIEGYQDDLTYLKNH